jgi:hypothetical protein
MGITFDPLRSRINSSAKMKRLSLDPYAGCLISTGVPAAKESLDVGIDAKSREKASMISL